jgi:hypothetical protein
LVREEQDLLPLQLVMVVMGEQASLSPLSWLLVTVELELFKTKHLLELVELSSVTAEVTVVLVEYV